MNDLADFVKISTLYPPNNERVQIAVKTVVEQVDKIRGNQSRLRVRLIHDRFHVNHVVAESDKVNTHWLAECMADTALGGIALQPTATADSLLEFTAILRRNVSASRNARVFEDLWSDKVEGLQLLERLYGIGSDRWKNLSEETRAILEEESPRGDLLREALEGEDQTLEQVMRVFNSEDDYAGDDWVDSVEFLRRIVTLLPENLLEESLDCIDLIQSMVDANSESISTVEKMDLDLGELHYRRMALDVSKHYFNGGDRFGAEATSLRRDSFTPYDETGEVEDGDLDAFLGELEELPDGPTDTTDEEELAAWEEKLAIGMHRLLRIEETRDTEALERSLIDQVAHADGPKTQRILRLYLEHICAPRPGQEPFAHLWGLASMFERTGLLGKMIDFKILTAEIVAATFPQMFSVFVDSLSDSTEDSGRLARVCELVGPARLMAMQNEFITQKQRERIYATTAKSVLPIALMAMEANEYLGRHELSFLGSLKLEDQESLALRVIDDPEFLPYDYVRKYCRYLLDLGGRAAPLRNMSESLLREYIENPPENAHMSRRVLAIGALRQFWSPRTESFARKLLKGTGFLRLKKQPKQIRAAVQTLLRTMEK